MNWLAVLTAASIALVAVVFGLRAIGSARWAAMVRMHCSLLESLRINAPGQRPYPARYDVGELVSLPAPVQRYFRAVLTDGQPIIAAASIEMTGNMNLSATGEQWKPFTSHQRVATMRPGFLWNAKVAMFPGLPALVEDSYIAGRGRLIARLFGLFTVAESVGDKEIARGEFMRYFAEAAWYPTALLPSQGVQWQAVDNDSASATIVDGPISLTMLFRFNKLGLIASVHSAARGAGIGKHGKMVMLPWDCTLADYQRTDGMLIPQTGEAAWMRTTGRKAYFIGYVNTLRYTFLS